MKRTPLQLKETLCALIRQTFANVFPTEDITQNCIRVSGIACHVLKDMGMQACMQAGTALWPYKSVLLSDDDTNTFGYEFHSREAMKHLLCGRPPEIHAWVGLVDTQEIIDFTAAFQPAQCKKMLGQDWSPESKLPDFIWHNVEDCCNKGWHYKPSPMATQFAIQLWNNQLRSLRGEPELPLQLSCTARG